MNRHEGRHEHRQSAQPELHGRQHRRAAQVELEPHRLKDRKLHRRRPRPPAQRQGNCETCQADQEHRHQRARHHGAQHRHLQMPENRPRRHPQRGRQTEPLRRNALPPRQDHSDRQRQVEEYMRQHDTMEPVDRNMRQPQRPQRAVHDPRPSEYREQPEHGHDHRQQERRPHQRNQQPSARKSPARQRPRHRHRQSHGQNCRNGGLHDGKAHGCPIRRTKRCRPAAQQHDHQCSQRQKRKDRRNGDPRPPHRDSAARHSSSAPARAAAASSALISNVFSGRISVAKPSGNPAAGVTAGYIQFVVGIAP